MQDYTLQVALCDDEPEVLSQIADMLQRIAAEEGIRCQLTPYNSARDLLEAIGNGAQYHALLLDVMMDGMTGIDLAATLRQQQDHSTIIFISSNRDMALFGYEVSAARYLMKPVDPQKLREALLLCYRTGLTSQQIVLLTARGLRKLSPDDIIYAETWGRELRITLTDSTETAAMKLSDLEALLPENQFTMCHRTILVNLTYVKYLRYCELELKTGGTLPVSKYRQNAVREKLFNYLSD